jgi:hypothetical protein
MGKVTTEPSAYWDPICLVCDERCWENHQTGELECSCENGPVFKYTGFVDSWGNVYKFCTADHPKAVNFGPEGTSYPTGQVVKDLEWDGTCEEENGWTYTIR